MFIFSFFHVYGLIIGVSFLISLFLIEKKAKKYGKSSEIDHLFFPVIVAGIIGSRLWHVLTDFDIYLTDVKKIFFIWEGGLSIIGGVVGGTLSLCVLTRNKARIRKTIFDCIIFGLPFGQAIGRLGNFFNQELYGLPTDLPWKLYIDPQYRLAEYTHISFYHPLFFYEMIITVAFGIYIWYKDRHTAWVGTGIYAYGYLLYYSVCRFLLDFLRIDKAVIIDTVIGVNQLVLLSVAVYSGVQLKLAYEQTQKK